MRFLLALLLVGGCVATTAVPPASTSRAVDEVRNAEIAFAAAFRDRDRDAFFSLVAHDATFFGPNRTLRGRDEVIEVWSGFFESPSPPFSWEPQRVEVTARGDVGFSNGPIRNSAGEEIGTYTSIWQKQADGRWKVIFDGPGCMNPPPSAGR